MLLINLFLGVLLLLGGRKFFIFFISAAGFIAGYEVAMRTIPYPGWIAIIVGLLIAAIAAFLAVFIKEVAVGLAGFLMGGYIFGSIGGMVGMGQGLVYWGLFLVGGLAGALLISFFFNFTLIWLSAAAGTFLLAPLLPWTDITRTLVSAGILFVGVVIQTFLWGGEDDDDD
jgi:hypothetical protein